MTTRKKRSQPSASWRKWCPTCAGTGYLKHKVGIDFPPQCPTCEGHGEVDKKSRIRPIVVRINGRTLKQRQADEKRRIPLMERAARMVANRPKLVKRRYYMLVPVVIHHFRDMPIEQVQREFSQQLPIGADTACIEPIKGTRKLLPYTKGTWESTYGGNSVCQGSDHL